MDPILVPSFTRRASADVVVGDEPELPESPVSDEWDLRSPYIPNGRFNPRSPQRPRSASVRPVYQSTAEPRLIYAPPTAEDPTSAATCDEYTDQAEVQLEGGVQSLDRVVTFVASEAGWPLKGAYLEAPPERPVMQPRGMFKPGCIRRGSTPTAVSPAAVYLPKQRTVSARRRRARTGKKATGGTAAGAKVQRCTAAGVVAEVRVPKCSSRSTINGRPMSAASSRKSALRTGRPNSASQSRTVHPPRPASACQMGSESRTRPAIRPDRPPSDLIYRSTGRSSESLVLSMSDLNRPASPAGAAKGRIRPSSSLGLRQHCAWGNVQPGKKSTGLGVLALGAGDEHIRGDAVDTADLVRVPCPSFGSSIPHRCRR